MEILIEKFSITSHFFYKKDVKENKKFLMKEAINSPLLTHQSLTRESLESSKILRQ